jgi:glycerol uptake facilitator-like aquaporin
MDRDLARRASAEAVGTALLVAIVVGSGIAAQRLSPGNVGLQLLENSIATGAGLVALILAIGPVSGAHFNPVVTLADRLLGGMTTRVAAVYVVAQVIGAIVGAIVANLMFGLAAVTWSTHGRSGGGLWLGEFVATFGLLLIILGVVRARREAVAAFAVGGYITAAYWFTSSTSFANPAVAIGRMFSNTFAGIAPRNTPMFVVFEVLGALAAIALAKFWNPNVDASDLVVPHPFVESEAEESRRG